MNRKVLFIAIAAILMMGILYIQSTFVSEPQQTAEVIVQKVNTIQLVKKVAKSSQIKSSDYIVVTMDENEAIENGVQTNLESAIQPGSLYRHNLEAGTFLKNSDVANSGDEDYIFLSLRDDEVPYYYEVSNPGIIGAVPINAGDEVSFVVTTSSEENIKEQGYSELDSIVSRIIISGAKVVKVNDFETSEDGDVNSGFNLIVALKVNEVLKLEMAQKISEVSLVPSNLSQHFISIKSSDIVDGLHGVRELRAGR
ncbi:pilus assembly protein CpaB [uncultured Photobacterium sp.]|uniref:pilus assembly protein CpaB n=1 Tax=uncultured Photobacterium sp. TaxID=173973 RepID=UPI002613D8B9|nr:pilus assembly protein CpaB [uncultured Photobacterium sp.]